MKLIPHSFCPSFQCFSTATQAVKNKTTELVNAVARFIFSAMVTVRNAIIRCFRAKRNETELVGTKVLKIEEWKSSIPKPVQKVVTRLFKDSKYSIDTIPCYPRILVDKSLPTRIDMKDMTSPVMAVMSHGLNRQKRPYIAIQMDCKLTEENIQELGCDEYHIRSLRRNPKVQQLYFIGQFAETGEHFWGGQGELMWEARCQYEKVEPQFFSGNFTYAENGGLTEGQKENFERLRTLLQTGECTDTQGIVWRLPAS